MRRSSRKDFAVNVDILTGTAAYANVVPAKTGYLTFITDITLSITAHVAADAYLVDDDGAGSAIAVFTDVVAGNGVLATVNWSFGHYGTPVTAAANVDVSHSSTGVARMHIEGYYRKA